MSYEHFRQFFPDKMPDTQISQKAYMPNATFNRAKNKDDGRWTVNQLLSLCYASGKTPNQFLRFQERPDPIAEQLKESSNTVPLIAWQNLNNDKLSQQNERTYVANKYPNIAPDTVIASLCETTELQPYVPINSYVIICKQGYSLKNGSIAVLFERTSERIIRLAKINFSTIDPNYIILTTFSHDGKPLITEVHYEFVHIIGKVIGCETRFK